ncbi:MULTISPECIES: phage tail protein [Paraburkholderia]|uniref:Microcystin-dependent protein n=2 Tax=Paraburkholderia TaxID=1822464 RepID=A0A7Y9WV14_9BURK|nr:tail fiber protein [Paraburkholderia bryophila]NYH27689.1 microcystin-dependent protein [Paraburkholderia bryophila]
MSDPFLGEIRMVGFNFAPVGWALCQGQIVSVSQNSALFALLGTTFGGNGQTSFGLPNFSSRSPVGTGSGPGLSTIDWGEISGNENITLNQLQLPQHTHVATATGGSGTAQVSVPATTATTNPESMPAANAVLGPASASGHAATIYSTATANTTLAPFNVSVQTPAPTVTVAQTGSNAPVPLRNPYLGTTFIIALQGVYPSRG